MKDSIKKEWQKILDDRYFSYRFDLKDWVKLEEVEDLVSEHFFEIDDELSDSSYTSLSDSSRCSWKHLSDHRLSATFIREYYKELDWLKLCESNNLSFKLIKDCIEADLKEYIVPTHLDDGGSDGMNFFRWLSMEKKLPWNIIKLCMTDKFKEYQGGVLDHYLDNIFKHNEKISVEQRLRLRNYQASQIEREKEWFKTVERYHIPLHQSTY